MQVKARLDAARSRQDALATGFDASALSLAGVTEEVQAAEDELEQLLEDEVERPQAERLPADEVSRRSACPPHLYGRLYG